MSPPPPRSKRVDWQPLKKRILPSVTHFKMGRSRRETGTSAGSWPSPSRNCTRAPNWGSDLTMYPHLFPLWTGREERGWKWLLGDVRTPRAEEQTSGTRRRWQKPWSRDSQQNLRSGVCIHRPWQQPDLASPDLALAGACLGNAPPCKP